MTEKRYYEKDYEELYYIFDSKTLSEKEFEKKVEYDGYDLFADSLTSKEVLDLLNENEELKQENNILNKKLKKLKKELKFHKKEKVELELDNLYFKNLENVIEENKQLKHDNILYEVDKIIDNKIKFLQKDIKELRKCINPYPVKEGGIKRG